VVVSLLLEVQKNGETVENFSPSKKKKGTTLTQILYCQTIFINIMRWQTIGARFKSDEIEKLDRWIKGESRNKVLRELVLTAIESGLSCEDILTVMKNAPRLSLLTNEEQRLTERILRLREKEERLKKSITDLENYEHGLREKIIHDFLTTPTLNFFTPVAAPKEEGVQNFAEAPAYPEEVEEKFPEAPVDKGEEKKEEVVVKKNRLRIDSSVFKKR